MQGINPTKVETLLKKLGQYKFTKGRIHLLNPAQEQTVQALLQNAPLQPHTSKNIQKKNLAHLLQIKHYKGLRFLFHLPVNGQRTQTNRKTARKLNGGKSTANFN